jgi:hypothetical protein
MEVKTTIEAMELEKDGTIKRVKFWDKHKALAFLARTQEIAGAVNPVEVTSADIEESDYEAGGVGRFKPWRNPALRRPNLIERRAACA